MSQKIIPHFLLAWKRAHVEVFLRCPLDFDNGAWTFGRKQEEYKFPNSTTTRSVVRRRLFLIFKYIHKYICGIPDIPSIPYIPGRAWFAFSPLLDHVHYLPNHVYHLPDHVHHISHINTNILLGICWYPWYQIYFDVRSFFLYKHPPSCWNFYLCHTLFGSTLSIWIRTLRWRRGSVQEVAWLSGGKHAGGYTYRWFSSLTRRNLGFNISSNRNLFALFVNTVRRTVHFFHVSYRILRLCPLSKFGKRALTEKCFQRMPLRFFTNKTWIRTLHRSGKVSRCHRKMNQKQTWSCNKNLFSQDGGPWRHIEPHWRRSHRAASGRKWQIQTKGCGRPTTTLAR